jgi:hypothetical protein
VDARLQGDRPAWTRAPQEFRASWEAHLRAAGVNPEDLATYAGHSVATANSRYVQGLGRSADDVRRAIG